MSFDELFNEPAQTGPLRILTVCTGNICRSPLAEVLLRKVLQGLPVEVSSAGTSAMVGHTMPDPQLRIAANLGVEGAEQHRARQLTAEMLEESDLVIALSREHRRIIAELSPKASRSTFTLRELARISASVDDEELALSDGGAQGMRAVVALASQLRGSVLPPENAEDDDVIDPFRQSIDVYQQSAEQLIPAVNSTVSLLRRAAGRP